MSISAEQPSAIEALLDKAPRLVILIPSAASLNCTSGTERMGSVITMRAALARRQSMRSKSGEDLSGLEWCISLHRQVDHEMVTSGERIGSATFVDSFAGDTDFAGEPATFDLWASLGAEQFDRLLSVLAAGRSVSYIRAHLIGLEFDYHPDGSGKVWDTTDRKTVALTGLEWGMGLTPNEEQTEQDMPDTPTAPALATAQDVAAMTATMKAATEESSKMLGWILFAVVIGVFILAFR